MEVREPSAKYLAGGAFKQTEVGLIPEDWLVGAISELCSVAAARDLVEENFSHAEDDEYPHPIYSNALGNGGLYGYSSVYQYPADSLTVTARGDVGHAMYRDKCFAAIGRLLVLQRKANIDLRYLTDTINERVIFALESTGVPQLTAPQIGSYKVAYPPTLQEQQAIATALSDAGALIESLEQLLAKKRQIKQGAMQELLTAQRRLPGFSGSWEKKRLEELGRWVGGMTPSMQNSIYWENGVIPWISSGDVKSTRLYSTGYSVSETAVKDKATTLIPEKSIIVVVRSGILRNYFPVAMNMVSMAVNQDVKALIPSEIVSADYLLQVLIENGNRILARCLKSGTTVESVEFRWLKSFSVWLPSIAEQTAIAQVLSDMDADIAAVETRLTKARAIKQGMMQELLTGRIRLLSPSATVLPFPATPVQPPPAARPHNVQFEEAALLGMLAGMFGSEKFPLARVRRTKLLYLLHRRHEGIAEGYLKKAAGPYNPKTRYEGGEGIALQRGYVRSVHNGQYEGLMAGAKLAEAEAYVEKWHGQELRTWLAQFHYEKTEALELLATVDMAMVEIRRSGLQVSVDAVRQLIAADPEWRKKLEREIFSDAHIAQAMARSVDLFGEA